MKKDTLSIFINHPEITRSSKGASKEEIIKVESLLKIKLPKSYKDFLSQLGSSKFFGTCALVRWKKPCLNLCSRQDAGLVKLFRLNATVLIGPIAQPL